MLVQIQCRFFTAGLVIRGGMITHAAPILAFMIGWSAIKAQNYCAVRGWSWTKVDNHEAA